MSGNGSGARVKIVRHKLADGTVREYRYDLEEQARKRFAVSQRHGFRQIAEAYKQSPEFKRLSPTWQASSGYYMGLLEDEIGWMSLADLSNRKARGRFYKVRDDSAAYPAKADKLINVLRRMLGWAYERGMIEFNHAIGIGKLIPSTHSRAERIWNPEQEAALLTAATPDFAILARFALLTGIRQSDLTRLKWSQFDGQWLTYEPAKTRKSTAIKVHLPVYALEPLRALVADLSRCAEYMLTTDQGHPWAPENVKKRFREALAKADLSQADLTFHDLRGTLITRLLEAGCTDAETAAISGHAIGGKTQLRAYAARSRELAVNAYAKLNRAVKGGEVVVFRGGK